MASMKERWKKHYLVRHGATCRDDGFLYEGWAVIDLKIPPRIGFNDNRFAYLKKSSPFIENKCAVLIHRPVSVEYRKDFLSGKTYLSVDYACGNGSNGADKFTLLDVVPEGRVVCARCEEAAIAQGLPSSSELSGRHVCIGGVKAVSFCCREKANA